MRFKAAGPRPSRRSRAMAGAEKECGSWSRPRSAGRTSSTWLIGDAAGQLIEVFAKRPRLASIARVRPDFRPAAIRPPSPGIWARPSMVVAYQASPCVASCSVSNPRASTLARDRGLGFVEQGPGGSQRFPAVGQQGFGHGVHPSMQSSMVRLPGFLAWTSTAMFPGLWAFCIIFICAVGMSSQAKTSDMQGSMRRSITS